MTNIFYLSFTIHSDFSSMFDVYYTQTDLLLGLVTLRNLFRIYQNLKKYIFLVVRILDICTRFSRHV